MRHQKRVKKLGLPKSHRTSVLKNLTTSLIMNERLQTTRARAGVLAAHFAHLMRSVKTKPDREAIRITPKYLHGNVASRKLMSDIKKRFENRTSGFTRITRIKNRTGDNATVVLIELT